MILSRLTHFVTLSLRLERRGEASTPSFIVLWLYPTISTQPWRQEAGMSTPDSAAVCHRLQPVRNLQSLLLSPLDLGSRSWDALVSFLISNLLWRGACLPSSPRPVFHHQPLEKSHRHMCVVTKLKSLGCLFQRKEWSCLLRENWIRKGEEGNERGKKKLLDFASKFLLKVWVLWARKRAGAVRLLPNTFALWFSVYTEKYLSWMSWGEAIRWAETIIPA